MLEVELDVFSGMPNPAWILSEREERELLDRLSAEPGQISPIDTAEEQFSLGYRGLIVREIKSDKGAWSAARIGQNVQLPSEFRLGSRPARESAAPWLLGTSEKAHKRSGVTDVLREIAAEGVALVETPGEVSDPSAFALPEVEESRFPTMTGEDAHAPEASGGITTEGVTWWACPSNFFSPNIAFFNDPAHVGRNNCYCFASNHRADVRFALPGKRGGHPATSLTCAAVTAGLYADGWKDGCQTNGLTIVMVIWPGNDYHFYRLVTGGPYWWWGHKPGGTPAKYTDDCGHAIYQHNGQGYAPNNICRGHYTDFCGYFYQNNATAFVA